MTKRDNKIKSNIEDIIVNASRKSAEENRKKSESKIRRKHNISAEHQAYKTILPKEQKDIEEVEKLKERITELEKQNEEKELTELDEQKEKDFSLSKEITLPEDKEEK